MEHNKLRVGVFVPCCVDQFMVATAHNLVKILASQGCDCRYAAGLACCGQRLYACGHTEGAKSLGAQMLEALRDEPYVVTCSSGCAAYLRHDLPRLFANSALFAEAQALAAKVYEATDFLVSILRFSPPAFPHPVALLDHGRSLRDYGLRHQPRQLLQAMEGLTLAELGELDADLLFAAEAPEPALRMVAAAVDRAKAAGARFILATEPSLLLLLRSYCAKHSPETQCLHIVDALV